MGLAHGLAVVVQDDDDEGQEEGAVKVRRLADHGQGVDLLAIDDVAGGVEVDVGQLGQGDQEGRARTRAQEPRQHLGRQLAGGAQLLDIVQAGRVVGGQGAVIGGDAGATGGQGAFQQHGVHAGVLLEDMLTQAGLDDEIHLVEQVRRQAGTLDGGGVQGRVDLGPLDCGLGGRARQLGAVVAQQEAQGFVVATLDNDVGHGLGHGGTLGHGAQVVLAVDVDDAQQVILGQDAGDSQNHRGDVGLVIG